jgi:hypothetical protein
MGSTPGTEALLEQQRGRLPGMSQTMRDAILNRDLLHPGAVSGILLKKKCHWIDFFFHIY